MKGYQAHYDEGWLLLRKVLSQGKTAQPSMRDKAAAAADHFVECLKIAPDSWPCMWGLGKAEQVLGNHDASLEWFTRAGAIEPKSADVWREASIAALAVERVDEATEYAERAHRLSPSNPGLQANLALALLVAQRDAEAQDAAEQAHRADPDDEVSRNVLRLIKEVRDGKISRPRRIPI